MNFLKHFYLQLAVFYIINCIKMKSRIFIETRYFHILFKCIIFFLNRHHNHSNNAMFVNRVEHVLVLHCRKMLPKVS